MNNSMITLILSTLLMPACVAVPPGPPAVGSGPEVVDQVPPPPPPGPQGPGFLTTQAEPIQGTVERYLLSPHGEVDGLLLKDGTCVKFPPHMGSELQANVKPGDPVTVTPQFVGPSVSQVKGVRAYSITNNKSAQTLVDRPPTVPPVPPHLRGIAQVPLSASGKVSHVLVNDRGEIDGLLLSGGEEVKFPPHLGVNVQAAHTQAPDGKVNVQGYGVRNDSGTVIDAASLTINGNSVWAQGPAPALPPPPRRAE